MPGVSVKDVDQHVFVNELSLYLKRSGKIKLPEWVDLVKTAKHKELAPYNPDWYFIRAEVSQMRISFIASMARHLYIRAPVGVGAFTKVYGGRKNNGTAPSHHSRGCLSIARRILKSLETLKLVEKDPNGGRKLSSQGRRDLDRIAYQIHSKHHKVAKAAKN